MKVGELEALFGFLKKSERNNRSLTAIALARALRHAEILGEVELELEDTFVEGDAFGAKLYKVRLRNRFGVLVHYKLRGPGDSSGPEYTETGLAFFDSWSGQRELLYFEGQRADEPIFASMFRVYEARLREFLQKGPFGYMEMAYPRDVADRPMPPKPPSLEEMWRIRAEALDELQRQAQKLSLDYY